MTAIHWTEQGLQPYQFGGEYQAKAGIAFWEAELRYSVTTAGQFIKNGEGIFAGLPQARRVAAVLADWQEHQRLIRFWIDRLRAVRGLPAIMAQPEQTRKAA